MTLTADSDGKLTERHEGLYVNGVRYLIGPSIPPHAVEPPLDHTGGTLATVIDVRESPSFVEGDWVQQCITHYEEIDDVFRKEFLQVIVFSGGQKDSSISLEAEALLQGFGMQWYHFLAAGTRNQPSPGPYILLDGTLHEPFRLFSDENAAFFSTTRNVQNVGDFEDTHGQIEIAVPSRLRSRTSTRYPMSGIRVAVKDNFNLEGTKTSLCSRSYIKTYPKKGKSATCIQKLVDLGACIVGKTKLCSFAQWEEPTEAIEYTSPWNPRADGFQSSGGSSNGSGAAIGAYEWLDIAIGSDSKTSPKTRARDQLFMDSSNWKYIETCPLE